MLPRTLLAALAALVIGLAASGAASGATERRDAKTFDEDSALATSRGALGHRLGDHRLTAPDGTLVTLAGLTGRPLIISFVYTSCVHTCPIVTQTLERAVEVARDTLGRDSFRVATIGFDAPRDTPERMEVFASQQGVGDDGWLFLSADANTVAALAEELGFVFFRSPKGFDHITQTTLIDGEGRVVRQIYGPNFEPPALVEPLMDIALGRPLAGDTLGGLIDRLRLFCTIYDPRQDRYRLDYSIFVAFAVGTFCLGGVAIFLVRNWRHSRSQGTII
ncbi:MAG: SCO family protein [Alphaproteobacteria bacterium]